MTPTPQPSFRARPGSKTEAKVRLGSVDPPDAGVTPTVEFHASSSSGALKVAVSIYDANTTAARVERQHRQREPIEELRLDAERCRGGPDPGGRVRPSGDRFLGPEREEHRQPPGRRACIRHARPLGRRPPHGQRTALHQLPALERRSPDRSEDRDQDLDHSTAATSGSGARGHAPGATTTPWRAQRAAGSGSSPGRAIRPASPIRSGRCPHPRPRAQEAARERRGSARRVRTTASPGHRIRS